ncbi:ABC transporter substrate-binding protein [Shouchella clausii]|uniref:ABC transporter substrate-binding protein n=1 Tax=Shouchella clausii TaxID=79880 RepID=UPI000BA6BE99|nr:ABC transporter substrate-binding protein [Shouchella clausii]PAD91103.1 sugar ABC transporter substrate-binding protein [Shouchella clausii]
MKKSLLYTTAASVLLVSLAACNSAETGNDGNGGNSTDTVTVWTYPVHEEYESELKESIAEFEDANPDIKIEYEILSWAEGEQKFDIALNTGSPPDLYFGKALGKYKETQLLVELDGKLNIELADYDDVALDHMRIEGSLYGLPLYQYLHVWGGNKALLEEYGIDYEKIQNEGWTWDEFYELANIGEQTNDNGDRQYGFVFQGVDEELLDHLARNNGLPYRMTEDGIAWTDERILEAMEFIIKLREEGIMPNETAAIDAAKRNEMFYNHQALIYGRAIPYSEPSAEKRNEDIRNGDIDGEEIEFVLLPTPHNEGQEEVARGGAEGYLQFTQKGATEEHIGNSVKVLEHLAGADAIGQASSALALPIVHKQAAADYDLPLSELNERAAQRLAGKVLPPNNINSELAAKDDMFNTQVVVPTFQALMNGETTPEQALEKFKTEAESAQFKP